MINSGPSTGISATPPALATPGKRDFTAFGIWLPSGRANFFRHIDDAELGDLAPQVGYHAAALRDRAKALRAVRARREDIDQEAPTDRLQTSVYSRLIGVLPDMGYTWVVPIYPRYREPYLNETDPDSALFISTSITPVIEKIKAARETFYQQHPELAESASGPSENAGSIASADGRTEEGTSPAEHEPSSPATADAERAIPGAAPRQDGDSEKQNARDIRKMRQERLEEVYQSVSALESAVQRLTLVVRYDGFYLWIAEFTSPLTDARVIEVHRGLRNYIYWLAGGEFFTHYAGLDDRDWEEENSNAEEYERDPSVMSYRKDKLGILNFFQLNTILEGMYNSMFDFRVFFDDGQHPARLERAKRNYSLGEFAASISAEVRFSGHLPQEKEPDVRGFIASVATLLPEDARAVSADKAKDIARHALDVRHELVADGPRVDLLRQFLRRTAVDSLQELKWRIERCRRALLDTMIEITHRRDHLIQLEVPDKAEDIIQGVNEAQLRGYIMLLAAKLPLITNVKRYLEDAHENIGGDAAHLLDPLYHSWVSLGEAIADNIRGLERAIEQARMDRMVAEEEKLRAEEETVAEIERIKSSTSGGLSQERAFTVSVIANVIAVIAVTLTVIGVAVTQRENLLRNLHEWFTGLTHNEALGDFLLGVSLLLTGVVIYFISDLALTPLILGVLRRGRDIVGKERKRSEQYYYEMDLQLDLPIEPREAQLLFGIHPRLSASIQATTIERPIPSAAALVPPVGAVRKSKDRWSKKQREAGAERALLEAQERDRERKGAVSFREVERQQAELWSKQRALQIDWLRYEERRAALQVEHPEWWFRGRIKWKYRRQQAIVESESERRSLLKRQQEVDFTESEVWARVAENETGVVDLDKRWRRLHRKERRVEGQPKWIEAQGRFREIWGFQHLARNSYRVERSGADEALHKVYVTTTILWRRHWWPASTDALRWPKAVWFVHMPIVLVYEILYHEPSSAHSYALEDLRVVATHWKILTPRQILELKRLVIAEFINRWVADPTQRLAVDYDGQNVQGAAPRRPDALLTLNVVIRRNDTSSSAGSGGGSPPPAASPTPAPAAPAR